LKSYGYSEEYKVYVNRFSVIFSSFFEKFHPIFLRQKPPFFPAFPRFWNVFTPKRKGVIFTLKK